MSGRLTPVRPLARRRRGDLDGQPRAGSSTPRAGRVVASSASRGRQARSWLWPVLRPYRRQIALAAAAVLGGAGIDLLMPYVVKVAVDDGVTAGNLRVLNAMVGAYVALAVVGLVANRLDIRTVATVGEQAMYAIRTRLFRHLQALSLDFYEHERTGRIVARMTNDIEAMSNVVSSGLVNLITSVLTLFGIAGVLVWLDWQLAVVTLLVAPLLTVAASWFRRGSAAAWRRVRETGAAVTARYQETLSGIRTIQAFRREDATAAHLAAANDAERRAHLRTISYTSRFFPGVEFAGTLATVIVLGFGGWRALGGVLEVGTLVAFVLYLRNLFDPIQRISELYDQVQAATAGAERVGAVLAREPTVRDHPDAVPLPDPRGEVELDGVTFTYAAPPSHPDDEDPPDSGGPGSGGQEAAARDGDAEGAGRRPPALRQVRLRVPAGATLALVGPTGAGKSTLAKLVARFYDPDHGQVRLDGVDLRRVRLADLRAALGYVPQEGFLFSTFDGRPGTVADNIAYGRPGASRAEVEAAGAAVGADVVIRRLPKGYDTEVGERGAMLSAGERQLVAFARAWIADPRVLILDEATSNLDVVTEARIQEALRRLRADRTTIIIAHRLSTVAQADLVAVVEDGRVVEQGPPATLLTRDGRYAELYGRWLAGAA